MMGSPTIRKRREALAKKQNDKCFYCARMTSWAGSKQLFPVAEHFKPQWMRQLHEPHHFVLACAWCDKAKGMIPGSWFLVLVQTETKTRPFLAAMAGIKRKAKVLNIDLHKEYSRKLSALQAAA